MSVPSPSINNNTRGPAPVIYTEDGTPPRRPDISTTALAQTIAWTVSKLNVRTHLLQVLVMALLVCPGGLARKTFAR